MFSKTNLIRRPIYLALILVTSFVVAQHHHQHNHHHQHQPQQFQAIRLESVEDLEHVAYLSLRNYNLTDETLLSLSRQHQKVDDTEEVETQDPSETVRQRLASQLEFFISHLRLGHLRRLELDELASIALDSNLTLESSQILFGSTKQNPGHGKQSEQVGKNESGLVEDNTDRCRFLVLLYQFELDARLKNSGGQSQLNDSSTLVHPSALVSPNAARLHQLCLLAVNCQSPDELVDLISGPWIESRISGDQQREQIDPRIPISSRIPTEIDPKASSWTQKPRAARSSLRDSLSSSLAKLCPLILFQLHDNEETCNVRRDDRPQAATVWAFASLFVTIVSFCSLIGLSITPLLGQTSNPDDDTSLCSQSTDSSSDSSNIRRHQEQFQQQRLRSTNLSRPSDLHQAQLSKHPKHQHRACLTLFEGLAVGSLVGSALFSLIPQAFELQERESNQSFLLKALIIFFGIYLFFCSERIMRIILDTRQKRKRSKSINTRASTSLPFQPATSIAFERHQRQRLAKIQLERKSPRSLPNRLAVVSANNQSIETRPKTTGSKRVKYASSENQVINKVESLSGNGAGASQIRGLVNSSSERGICDKSDCKSDCCSSYSSQESEEGHFDDEFQLEQLDTEDGIRKRLGLPALMSSSSEGPAAKMLRRIQENARAPNRKRLTVFRLKSSKSHSSTLQRASNNDTDQRQQLQSSLNRRMPTYQMSRVRTLEGNQASGAGSVGITVGGDISTVAWMIIIGDGLHNFIDGISIGAAFSESILSGVSISVAVICEEFPHELGDFAVLVSSGMTVHQALGYNFLSACTCYVGMAFGIILGDAGEGASYISALAAGVFLYIALVDMMSELSATLEESSRNSIGETLKLLLLQNVGIFIGISIIFVLSFIDF